ncbi:LexA family transcriptional regulator [Enterococcus faecalis]|uniref:LexA family transcriptional regulator n=1 Tax=Enterococcus faecalis TaxID=1351 RepID=UPI004042B954
MTSKIVFGEMLDYFRKQKGWTMDELGKQVGKTKSAVSRWVSGENYPKMDEVERLTKLFDTDVETLIFGANFSKNTEDTEKKIDTWLYDFYDVGIAAGSVETVECIYKEYDDVEQIEIADEIMGRYAGRCDIFFTRINGESMNKIIPDCSLIAVKKLHYFTEYRNDDLVLFSYDNGYSVKRFFNDEENKQLIFRPESTVKEFHDIVVPYEEANDLSFLGKVILYIVNMD